MKNELHVVLGAAGAIGEAVVEELLKRELKVRAVTRNKNIKYVETIRAELLDLSQTIKAVEGASHIYLCVGIRYNSKAWLEEWPKVMKNVIDAAEGSKARVIFLDNVYMYGPAPLQTPFDENHLQSPVSKKGKVRKEIADLLMDAHRTGRIKAIIGRSADFYGRNAKNSPIYISILDRMLLGKAPQALSSVDVKHTYANATDNGRALVALALDDSTYGQVWHLPVSEPATYEEVVSKLNKILETNYKIKMMPRSLLVLLSIFIPVIKEVREMIYQFDSPYIMEDNKFKKHFPDFEVTGLDKGLKAMVDSFRNGV